MLIARGTSESDDGKKGELLILGLTNENIRRLVQGKPMKLTRETHGEGVPEGWEIAILFGRTEDDLAQMLREAGAIDADTKINRDPKLNKTL